jgi:hypothetical protein
MLLEDCKNYRADFRAVVEDCITGKITKEQGLKLLESRYKFESIDIKENYRRITDKPINEQLIDELIATMQKNFDTYLPSALETINIVDLTNKQKELINDIEEGKTGSIQRYVENESVILLDLIQKQADIERIYKSCKSELENL